MLIFQERWDLKKKTQLFMIRINIQMIQFVNSSKSSTQKSSLVWCEPPPSCSSFAHHLVGKMDIYGLWSCPPLLVRHVPRISIVRLLITEHQPENQNNKPLLKRPQLCHPTGPMVRLERTCWMMHHLHSEKDRVETPYSSPVWQTALFLDIL